jgi:integrase
MLKRTSRGSDATLLTSQLAKGCPSGQRDFAILRLMRDLGLRGAEIVKLCLEDIDWRAGTLVVRDERLGANIKLQLDIVSFFDIDFDRPAEVFADQCAGP